MDLAIQRELARNISFEVAYVGSHITHVGIPDININQLTADQLAIRSSLFDIKNDEAITTLGMAVSAIPSLIDTSLRVHKGDLKIRSSPPSGLKLSVRHSDSFCRPFVELFQPWLWPGLRDVVTLS